MKTERSFLPAAIAAFALSLYAVPALAQETADEAVRKIYSGLGTGRLEVLWQALPPSYQSDVRQVLQSVAPSTEDEVQMWMDQKRVVGKLVQVLREKNDYIMGHPMVLGQMNDEVTPERLKPFLSALGDILDIFMGILADPRNLGTLDVEAYLADAGPKLFGIFLKLQEIAPPENRTLGKLGDTAVSVVSSEGDSARLRLETPGQPAEEQDFVQVEGKWLPQSLVENWEGQMAEVKGAVEMAALRSLDEQSIAQRNMMMGMLEQTLDQMLASGSQEEFNTAAQALVGAVMMAAMAAEGEEEGK